MYVSRLLVEISTYPTIPMNTLPPPLKKALTYFLITDVKFLRWNSCIQSENIKQKIAVPYSWNWCHWLFDCFEPRIMFWYQNCVRSWRFSCQFACNLALMQLEKFFKSGFTERLGAAIANFDLVGFLGNSKVQYIVGISSLNLFFRNEVSS